MRFTNNRLTMQVIRQIKFNTRMLYTRLKLITSLVHWLIVIEYKNWL